MWRYWDNVCGGGVWWTTDKTYKNAITNELMLKVNAALHNRIPGDSVYLGRARQEWDWFLRSGMINSGGLINDGLDSSCRNNGQTPWTYNQGVILGGLAELAAATGDAALLAHANRIADAATTQLVNGGGILVESCEPNCNHDSLLFKGIFVRNLAELSRVAGGKYLPFLQRQADSVWNQDRDSLNHFGQRWSGPLDAVEVTRQISAQDALNAALP
jgi:predicted alpha-1,6-mannanase (GH76 family)